MYVFSYKVKCHYWEEGEISRDYISTGMGFADSYSEAAEKVEAEYGEEIVEILSLYLMEEAKIIALPEEVIEDYKSKDFPDIEYQQPIEKE